MTKHEVTVWEPAPIARIPSSASEPQEVTKYGHGLRKAEVTQIVKGFEFEAYEMVSSFVLRKALGRLRSMLAGLGMEFVGEMLRRDDIDEDSDPDSVLTDFETLSLAEDLQVIGSSTHAMRLRQALETVNHFSRFEGEEQPDAQMTKSEALTCLQVCVEAVLADKEIRIPSGFAEFRRKLQEESLSRDGEEIATVLDAAPFYRTATLNVLLALLKSARGAQLECVTQNLALMLPLIWPKLRGPDRWHAGEAYAELHTDGTRPVAVTGLRRALLKVHGFDYVPEDLRSRSFRRLARRLLQAHFGANNFYNEPTPAKQLESLGTAIPLPALFECVTAALCSYLGTDYGVSWDAEAPTSKILTRLSEDRWGYYMSQCLPGDKYVLQKLAHESKPRKRWVALVKQSEALASLTLDSTLIRRLLKPKPETVASAARTLLERQRRNT